MFLFCNFGRMENYQNAFAQLNLQQKDAVTNIEGPVMVIAGPGTGKTQVIASRIAYILEKTDATPQNILCLTYTDAGAVAMKNRLIQFIGPTGHDVRICTFHSFCNEVIQENSDYFGQKELEQMDELEQIQIVKQIIDSFESKNPLKRYKTTVYYEVKNLINLFSIMRKENISYQLIESKIKAHLEELKTNDAMFYKRNCAGGKKGDFKQNDYDKIADNFNKTIYAAAEFENYLKVTKEKGYYDFDDMILWVKNAFQKNDFILRRYQERYQFILVDEYQDTNGSQNEIVQFLADYFENPNLFVVGDDDQSIYRFQGANMDNILHFQQKYEKHLHTIPMVVNYRSSQEILNAAMLLINNNTSRILAGDKKQLVAGNSARNTILPKIITFENIIHENAYISNFIKKASDNQENLSKIAVIYRNHKDAEPIIDFLQKNNVPVNAAKSVNILNEPLVKNLLTLLKYFQSELDYPYSNKSELYHLILLPWFKINHLSAANFSYWARIELNKWIYNDEVKDKNKRFHWRYLLNNLDNAKDILTENEQLQFKELNTSLEKILSVSNEYSLSQYFGYIMEECGVLNWIMNSKDKVWNLEVYRAFFDFIKAQTTKNPTLDFNDIFHILNTMIEENISINLSKTLINKNGVNFLTAHKSKGLEFETVFIINCVESAWNKKNRHQGFHFPPNLFDQVQEEELVAEEESRRLFYVAMTRAEQNLFITYSLENDKEKKMNTSKFVDELLVGNELVQCEKATVPEDIAVEFQNTAHSFTLLKPSLINSDWLEELLLDYRLSVTDMNTYLKCPVTFYYEKVLKIPAAKSQSLAIGSAAHEAIELFIKKSKEEKRMLQKDEFLHLFQIALDKQKSILTPLQYDSNLEYGTKFLGEYYSLKLKDYDLPNTIQEMHINARVDGTTLLKGMIDRIVEQPNSSVLVYDYKTGASKPKSFKQPNDDLEKDELIQKYGGDYWRQGVFYSLLLENSERNFNYNVHQVTFEFLESSIDVFKEEQVIISSDHKAFVRNLATETFTKIKNLEFDKGCEKEECKWCNMEA